MSSLTPPFCNHVDNDDCWWIYSKFLFMMLQKFPNSIICVHCVFSIWNFTFSISNSVAVSFVLFANLNIFWTFVAWAVPLVVQLVVTLSLLIVAINIINLIRIVVVTAALLSKTRKILHHPIHFSGFESVWMLRFCSELFWTVHYFCNIFCSIILFNKLFDFTVKQLVSLRMTK